MLPRSAKVTYGLLDVPVDEGALSGRVVSDEHDVDLLARRQQLDPHVLGDVAQTVLRIRVDIVAVAQNSLVHRHHCVVAAAGRRCSSRLANHSCSVSVVGSKKQSSKVDTSKSKSKKRIKLGTSRVE